MHNNIQILLFSLLFIFNTTLTHAQWTDPAPLVIAPAAMNVGYGLDLIEINGRPAAAVYDAANFELDFMRANNATGSSWPAPITVDNDFRAGGQSIDIEIVNGNPAVVGDDPVHKEIRYTRATDANGTSWGSTVIAASLATSYGGSLHLDLEIVSGNPAVAYYHGDNQDLEYVRANDANGDTWGSSVVVASTNNVGLSNSMEIVNGRPAIAFYDATDDDLKFVRANDATGASWGSVQSVVTTGNVGQSCSMAIVNGNPAIVYGNATAQDVEYVRALDVDGTSWGTPVTVHENHGGAFQLMVVNGIPAVAYYRNGELDLVYIAAGDINGDTWGTQEVIDNSSNQIGLEPSLALINGNPAVVYRDFANSNLKYAREVTDNTAPLTTSFTRKTPTTQNTNADQVTFLVTFNEDVVNVDANDFLASGTTASISVTPVTASTYDVQFSGGNLVNLNGTVGLNFAGSVSIQDVAGNALPSTEPGTDETYILDNTAPSTVSFTRKTPSVPNTNADQVTFLATFNEEVTNVDASDFESNGTTASVSITSSTTNTFCVQLSGGDLANLNGTVGLNIAAGQNIQDVAGNALPNTEPATDETYNVDNAGPMTVTFSPIDDATDVTITTNLVITFNENIQKGTGNILIKKVSDDSTVESIDVTTGQAVINSMMVTINPNANLEEATTYYIEIPNGCFLDGLGNPYAGISGNSDWNFSTVAPTISIALQNSPPSVDEDSGTDLVYRFSRTGSTAASLAVDFSTSGTTSNSDFTITVGGTGMVTTTGSNTGTIIFPIGQSTVDLPISSNSDNIIEINETLIVTISPESTYFVGSPSAATGTINNDDFPSVTSITLADVNPTSATTLNFTVTFSNAVTGVNAGDFTIDGTGVTASIGTVSGSNNNYNVQVTSVSGNGTLSIDLVDDNSITTNTQPLGGNAANDGNFTNGAEYDIDQTAPTTVSFTRKTPASEITNADQLTFLATFSEEVTGIDVSDFEAMSTTASVSIISSTTSTACIQLSGGDLDNLTETVGLNLSMTPTIQDLVGNALPNTEPATDETYNVNNTNPVTVSFSPMDDAMGVTITTDLVITFDKTIQKGTGNILIKRLSDDTVFETIDVTTGQVAVSGTMATINPSVNLDQATAYYIEIANTCFEDALGNQFAGISNNSTWNFETFIPSISIALQSTPTLSENSGTNFLYRFSRTGSTAQDLTINYSIGGTSDNNDYMVTTDANTTYATGTKTGTIKILAGNAFADLTIVLSNDSTVEISETIVVTIEAP